MIKRIAAWLANILHAEVAKVEADAAGLYPHISKEIADLKTELADAVVALKAHGSSEVERPTEAIAAHAAAEITKEFEKITAATKIAAQVALADARKALRMPCDICHEMSWKFIVSEAGKIVCGNCQQKGKA